jgi:hypothetical protein
MPVIVIVCYRSHLFLMATTPGFELLSPALPLLPCTGHHASSAVSRSTAQTDPSHAIPCLQACHIDAHMHAGSRARCGVPTRRVSVTPARSDEIPAAMPRSLHAISDSLQSRRNVRLCKVHSFKKHWRSVPMFRADSAESRVETLGGLVCFSELGQLTVTARNTSSSVSAVLSRCVSPHP